MSEEIIIEHTQEELDAIEAERVAEEARVEAERLAEIVRLEEVERLRVLEVLRCQDLKDRYQALKDHRAASAALGISNPDFYFKKEILENVYKESAEEKMSELESIDSEEDVKASFISYQEQRKKEYRSIEEVLHTILDHGLYSEEFFALQTERTQIKIKYPKE